MNFNLVLILAVFALTLLSGCTSKSNAPSLGTDDVHWESCSLDKFSDWFTLYDTELNTELQCATIDVPIELVAVTVNHPEWLTDTDSEPTVIKLAVSRLPATGKHEDRIGTLISIAGGPGQSGIGFAPEVSDAADKLREHFDLIGYAPRGVYPTTPVINCDNDIDDEDPDGAQKFAASCWEQTPQDLLAALGADSAINDIEAIRQAIDEPKVSLIGYSYGTKIATMYAEKYPDHIRAAVLDGVVNLNESDMVMVSNQHNAIQHSFERFVTDCRQWEDCFFNDTDTVAEAEAKMYTLLNSIDQSVIYDYDIDPIHAETTINVIITNLMWHDFWEYLNSFFYNLENEDYDMLRQEVEYAKNDIDDAIFTSINCADAAPNEIDKETYLDQLIKFNAISTWDNYRQYTDDEMLDPCYFWPIVGSDITHAPKLPADAPTFLLVAQTHDPATPYQNAVAMQAYLEAVLLTRDADGHTIVFSNESPDIDAKVVDYLINPDSVKSLKDKNWYSSD